MFRGLLSSWWKATHAHTWQAARRGNRRASAPVPLFALVLYDRSRSGLPASKEHSGKVRRSEDPLSVRGFRGTDVRLLLHGQRIRRLLSCAFCGQCSRARTRSRRTARMLLKRGGRRARRRNRSQSEVESNAHLASASLTFLITNRARRTQGVGSLTGELG